MIGNYIFQIQAKIIIIIKIPNIKGISTIIITIIININIIIIIIIHIDKATQINIITITIIILNLIS